MREWLRRRIVWYNRRQERISYGTCEDEKVGGDASSFAKATADGEAGAREGENAGAEKVVCRQTS